MLQIVKAYFEKQVQFSERDTTIFLPTFHLIVNISSGLLPTNMSEASTGNNTGTFIPDNFK